MHQCHHCIILHILESGLERHHSSVFICRFATMQLYRSRFVVQAATSGLSHTKTKAMLNHVGVREIGSKVPLHLAFYWMSRTSGSTFPVLVAAVSQDFRMHTPSGSSRAERGCHAQLPSFESPRPRRKQGLGGLMSRLAVSHESCFEGWFTTGSALRPNYREGSTCRKIQTLLLHVPRPRVQVYQILDPDSAQHFVLPFSKTA